MQTINLILYRINQIDKITITKLIRLSYCYCLLGIAVYKATQLHLLGMVVYKPTQLHLLSIAVYKATHLYLLGIAVHKATQQHFQFL